VKLAPTWWPDRETFNSHQWIQDFLLNPEVSPTLKAHAARVLEHEPAEVVPFMANFEMVVGSVYDDLWRKEVERSDLGTRLDEIWNGHLKGLKIPTLLLLMAAVDMALPASIAQLVLPAPLFVLAVVMLRSSKAPSTVAQGIARNRP
jgi:hypothetical protein